MTTSTIRVWAFTALVVMAAGFSSCLKSSDVTPQRDQAYATIINGILTNDQLDLFDTGTQLNKQPLSLGFASPYYFLGGIHSFTFKRTGQSADLATGTAAYDSLNYYTVVAYGDSTAPVVRSFRDAFTGAVPQKVNIRFFHLSPGVPAVDLYIDNQKVDSNRTFVGVSGIPSAFIAVPQSIYTNNIKVKLAGTDSVIVSNSSPNVTFNQNGAYTIFMTGIPGVNDRRKIAVNNIPHY
jgi:hypothetical protein